MPRLLSAIFVFAASPALAQWCPLPFCGTAEVKLRATITPSNFRALEASISSLDGRHESLTEPCAKLVRLMAYAETPLSVYADRTLVTVSDRFLPIDLTTGAAKIELHFERSALGLSCRNQMYALKDGALAFANLESSK